MIVKKSNYFYKAVFARMRTLALVLKNQNPFLNADFTKFFLKRLLNRQNGTFSIDLWNGFTENRKAIASRVWLDCYYDVGVGTC